MDRLNYYYPIIPLYILPAMQEHHEDFKELIYKLAFFFPGVILGLAAKLSRINKAGKLTLKELILQTCIAFSTAWAAYFILEYLGANEKLCAAASVLCGRFGDEIMLFLWKYAKMSMLGSIDNFKKLLK